MVGVSLELILLQVLWLQNMTLGGGDGFERGSCAHCIDPNFLLRSLAGLVEGDRLQLQLSRLLDLLDLECGWPLEEAVFLPLVVQVALDRGQAATVEDCAFHFALPSLVLGDKLVEELVRVDVLVLVLLRLLLVLLIRAPAIASLIPAASVRLHWGELALLEGIVL